jgi:phenylpropionate dioxygenase-like ring-hydroxylating dioxygenase large terminal subunit
MSTLVENLADPGHVPFTHHATVSKRSTSSIIDLKLTAKDRDGFDGVWEAGPRQGKLGCVPYLGYLCRIPAGIILPAPLLYRLHSLAAIGFAIGFDIDFKVGSAKFAYHSELVPAERVPVLFYQPRCQIGA